MKKYCAILLLLAGILLAVGCQRGDEGKKVVRLGCFPNITHVQALVARNMARHGEGWFERYLPGYTFEWYTYNAGPTAMEAIFGRTVDLTYVGPSPAINAYAVSRGREVRLLAGAVNGGAALLVAEKSGIQQPEDFRGRNIATPQLGNTQDVSCRAWLAQHGLKCSQEGTGDCRISPTPNAMQLQLMQQGNLDACWTVEPWLSLLEQKAHARILVQEPDVVTTVLAGRVDWLKSHPKEAQAITQAHSDLTRWILENPDEARRRVKEELAELTQAPVDDAIIDSAWKRLTPTDQINMPGLEQFVRDASNVGMLNSIPPISGILYQPEP